MLKPVGFWSYARQDDAHSDGQLSQLRALIGKAVNLRYGEELTLWQDIAAIPFGADWAATIERTIGQVTFFIPIITPRYLKSENCRSEFRAFRERMGALKRDDLIFPIYYVDVENLAPGDTAFGDDLVALRRQQWADFRPRAFDDPKSPTVRQWCDRFAAGVLEAMRRAPTRERPAADAPQAPLGEAPAAKVETPAAAEAPPPPGEPEAANERARAAEAPPAAPAAAAASASERPTVAAPPRRRRPIEWETDPKRIGLRFVAGGWFFTLFLAAYGRNFDFAAPVVLLLPPLALSLLRVNLPYATAITLLAMALSQQALGQIFPAWGLGDDRLAGAIVLVILFAIYLALSALLCWAFSLGRRLARRRPASPPPAPGP